jgi:hypothetical protein
MAFTRDDWNSLIDDVNNIIRHPPADTDCEPQTAINHVGTSHIWTKTDIQQVQNKIKATCSDISLARHSRLCGRRRSLEEIRTSSRTSMVRL